MSDNGESGDVRVRDWGLVLSGFGMGGALSWFIPPVLVAFLAGVLMVLVVLSDYYNTDRQREADG